MKIYRFADFIEEWLAYREFSREFGKFRRFEFLFWFTGWRCISAGVHVDLLAGHIEIHIPFGFIRIGWQLTSGLRAINEGQNDWRGFGVEEDAREESE